VSGVNLLDDVQVQLLHLPSMLHQLTPTNIAKVWVWQIS